GAMLGAGHTRLRVTVEQVVENIDLVHLGRGIGLTDETIAAIGNDVLVEIVAGRGRIVLVHQLHAGETVAEQIPAHMVFLTLLFVLNAGHHVVDLVVLDDDVIGVIDLHARGIGAAVLVADIKDFVVANKRTGGAFHADAVGVAAARATHA